MVFTDILAGFTFNNRVLRLPAIVFIEHGRNRDVVFNKNDCWKTKNSVVGLWSFKVE